MATGTIILPIAGAILPDGTTSNIFAELSRRKSSAAAPAPHWIEALMDASTDEALMWAFRMPVNYASALVAKLQYKMASATSGNVILGVQIMAVTDADAQDVDADAFATANTSAATTVPATAGYLDEISITCTNEDGVAANDFVIVRVYRDADNGSDTATGDLELLAVSLEYTTT